MFGVCVRDRVALRDCLSVYCNIACRSDNDALASYVHIGSISLALKWLKQTFIPNVGIHRLQKNEFCVLEGI